MDTMEATNKVLSRIQTFDHQNASKILGYILIREHGDKDVIRLAHGPDSVLLSLIGEAKSRLGLSSNGSSATSTPSPPSPSLGPFSQRITIPNDGFHSSSPWSNGSPVFSSSKTPVFSSEEKQRWSPNEDSEDGWRPPCMFTHFKSMHGGSHTGSVNEQFLGIKAAQLYGGHNPFTYNMSNLNENPRLAPASLMISEECQRFGHCPPQECDFLDGYSDACLRQIYLTFPADSTFSEEDVSNYFSIYGPVHDVRIPYQQKRMFGFVTFVYAETVKLILAKGNPHFVCDCRVLVKPYKEKGKILEKNRKHHHHHMDIGKLSACLSPSGLDSREPYDLPFGPRMFNVSREAMIRRKLEQEAELQKAIDLHSRRLMDLQLMDMKNKENYNQFPCSSSPVIPVSCQNNSRTPNYQVTAENNGSHEASVGQENNGGNEDSGKKQCNSLDNPELHKRGLEHILPGKLVASPVKSADENLPAPTETDDSFFPTPFSNNTPTLLGTSTSVCPLFNHVT